MKKFSLINDETPVEENVQQAKAVAETKRENTYKQVEAIVRTTAITKGNGRDKQK